MTEQNAKSTPKKAERVRFSDQVAYFRRSPSPVENITELNETQTENSCGNNSLTSAENFKGDANNPVRCFLSDSRRECLGRKFMSFRSKIGLVLYVILAIGFFVAIHLLVPVNTAKYIALFGLPAAAVGFLVCTLCIVRMEVKRINAANSGP